MKKWKNYDAFCTTNAAGLASFFLLRQNIAAFRYGELVAMLTSGFRVSNRMNDWLAISCAIK